MPAKGVRSEQITRTPAGRWRLRYYDRKGARHSAGVYRTQAEARQHFSDVIKPALDGRPAARRDLTFSGLVDVFLERHAVVAKPRTIAELRWRLNQSEAKFGTVPLVELEGMADEIAGWAVSLSERLRYPIMAALRQALEAGVRYGYLTCNPAKLAGPNSMPAPREIRVYTTAELKAITDELGAVEAAAVRWRPGCVRLSGPQSSGETSTRPGASSTSAEPRRSARAVRSLSRLRRAEHSIRSPLVSTAASCSPRRASVRGSVSRVRSTSRTSGAVSGGRRSTQPGSRRPPGCTTSGHLRVQRPCRGDHDVRACPDHGHVGEMIEQHYGTLIDTAHEAILSRLDAAIG